ncbi:LPS assembly lipoprotein LptE [Sedimentitalea nanhaiensis]|uniref:LPS-assembly lipoprotein n=1 Tax=Sedimentitalea nanhaiensis TaxID=999627 RepID=A0A1I7BYU4_9RHOB|nr:LPS assembly lipoprotein LptE [Sedimentitalea nanhaiensis]SFT92315.1 LPS-assembly lipoprotein [Sedimentitalea nanhaiensis]
MSLFDRRSVLFLPLALAACGFEPVYAPGGAANALYGKIRVDAPEGVNTYLLVRRLEEQLGRAQVPDYRLSIVLETGIQGQAITASGDITFYSVLGSARYRLLRIDTEELVATGSVDNFTGYSATGNTAETLAAQRDARERLMVILADQLARDLYMTADVSE